MEMELKLFWREAVTLLLAGKPTKPQAPPCLIDSYRRSGPPDNKQAGGAPNARPAHFRFFDFSIFLFDGLSFPAAASKLEICTPHLSVDTSSTRPFQLFIRITDS